ncbi:hypothetical protein [Tritonibacter mobilis]|uniref:hypothetical protein n=1 Tax=Tritonibacter mobilis TaxID=379347 RepID=UPI001C081DFE|nr:hypothetical protein [Tritonibacter mobilis]MBU3036596.1 hypothetical protein [Tritonibacter mobilis]WHQ84444.1 hypothetical protein OMR53_20045 [Tritonibacter mobilis]
MRSKYQQPRGERRETRTLSGRVRGGKLYPVMAQAFLGSESGVVSQTITAELDRIMGRLLTQTTFEVTCVMVPVLACRAVRYPDDPIQAGTDLTREKLLSGNPLFSLGNETEITQRMGVEPRKIGGDLKVSTICAYAHNAAVNYLRRRKYVKADQVHYSNNEITPALFGRSALQMLNGALDPEDRVNGSVDLELQDIQIPVKTPPTGANQSLITVADNSGDVVTDTHSQEVFADFKGASAGRLSLLDFYLAEEEDGLVRTMRKIVDQDPVHGEEQIRNWAHGLSLDSDKQPFVVYEKEHIFGTSMQSAMDGPNLDLRQTNSAASIDFTVPIPPTEFGGILVTFISIKPDETMMHQPHPILSEPWGAINFVADEMAKYDPVPVTNRELFADIDTADEETIAFYTGNNELKFNYVNYGFRRGTDMTTVENKSAMWQIQVPMSLTPSSIIYPDVLDHYPFALNGEEDEVCTYTVSSRARINTPLIRGHTPVEELAEIETSNLFEDAE